MTTVCYEVQIDVRSFGLSTEEAAEVKKGELFLLIDKVLSAENLRNPDIAVSSHPVLAYDADSGDPLVLLDQAALRAVLAERIAEIHKVWARNIFNKAWTKDIFSDPPFTKEFGRFVAEELTGEGGLITDLLAMGDARNDRSVTRTRGQQGDVSPVSKE